MNKLILFAAAVLALASSQAKADVIIGSFVPTASTGTVAPAGTTGAFGGALGPGGGVGGMDGGAQGFVAPFAGILHMTIEDCCLVGDVYQAFVDGLSLGYTLAEPIGGGTNSTGTFDTPVGAGAHTFDVADILLQYIGVDFPFGGGTVPSDYTPAGFTVTLSESEPVPEPATLALLGGGILGLGMVGRRRKASKTIPK